ncbi:hypothetical protein N9282_00605, partial [bacterium]|nr:hypothetical protein [bacterium]
MQHFSRKIGSNRPKSPLKAIPDWACSSGLFLPRKSVLRHTIGVFQLRSAQNSSEYQGLLRSAPASQKWTTAPVSAFSDQE